MGHVLPLSSLPLSVLWLLPQEGAGAAGLCAGLLLSAACGPHSAAVTSTLSTSYGCALP